MAKISISAACIKYGARQTAIKLIDQELKREFGIGFDDMPDTSERCDIIDTMEEMLENPPWDPKELQQLIQEAIGEEAFGRAMFD